MKISIDKNNLNQCHGISTIEKELIYWRALGFILHFTYNI